MSNMKELVKALSEAKSNVDIKLIGVGKQRTDSYDQETAVEISAFISRTDNYVLEINDRKFLFDVRTTKDELRYGAMEDEWVSDVTVNQDDVEYILTPYYVMDCFESIRDDLSESYTDDLKEGVDNVPTNIKALASELKKLSRDVKRIPHEDEDYENYLEEMKHENPDYFSPDMIEPIPVKSDLLFDLALNMDNLMDNVDFYDLAVVEPVHEESFPKSEWLENIKEKGINVKDFRKLNALANSSGNPSAFLNKFNKYSNTEMTEMFHMMDKGNKVVEIFSRDLDKYEPTQEIKKKRDRSNKPR